MPLQKVKDFILHDLDEISEKIKEKIELSINIRTKITSSLSCLTKV